MTALQTVQRPPLSCGSIGTGNGPVEEQEMAQAQIDRLYEMELRENLGRTALIQEAERRVAAVVQREELSQGLEMDF